MLASVSSGVVLELWCKHHLPIVTLSLDPSPPCFTDFRTLSIFTPRFFFHHRMWSWLISVVKHQCTAVSSQIQYFLVSTPTLSPWALFFWHFNSFTTAPFFWNFYARPKWQICQDQSPSNLFQISSCPFQISSCPFELVLRGRSSSCCPSPPDWLWVSVNCWCESWTHVCPMAVSIYIKQEDAN